MNKITMFIWGLIIFALWTVIIFIGYQKQDKKYIALTKDLKEVSNKYMIDNDINLKFNESVVIYAEDLVNGEYINEEDLKEYCINSVVISKGLIFNDYKINEEECKK